MSVRKIHFYKVVDSTNRKAYELAVKGGAHGELVWALSQTEGRGRLGKSWQSPIGTGLYLSILVRPKLNIENYSKITMTAGLAVAKWIEKLCGVKTELKWPNDIYIKGKKCCGILSEGSFTGEESDYFAVIGIGINVNSTLEDFNEEVVGRATSLHLETGLEFDLESLIEPLRDAVLKKISHLEQNKFTEILQEWEKKDFLKGRRLTWVTAGGEIIQGRSRGVDSSGQLLVKDDNGKIHEVISGDVNAILKK